MYFLLSLGAELAFSILSQSQYLNVIKPDGAFYIFANSVKTTCLKKPDGTAIKNDDDLCKYILEVGKVGVVPGSAFGSPNHFRVSYVADDKIVEEGCRRIVEALDLLLAI